MLVSVANKDRRQNTRGTNGPGVQINSMRNGHISNDILAFGWIGNPRGQGAQDREAVSSPRERRLGCSSLLGGFGRQRYCSGKKPTSGTDLDGGAARRRGHYRVASMGGPDGRRGRRRPSGHQFISLPPRRA